MTDRLALEKNSGGRRSAACAVLMDISLLPEIQYQHEWTPMILFLTLYFLIRSLFRACTAWGRHVAFLPCPLAGRPAHASSSHILSCLHLHHEIYIGTFNMALVMNRRPQHQLAAASRCFTCRAHTSPKPGPWQFMTWRGAANFTPLLPSGTQLLQAKPAAADLPGDGLQALLHHHLALPLRDGLPRVRRHFGILRIQLGAHTERPD